MEAEAGPVGRGGARGGGRKGFENGKRGDREGEEGEEKKKRRKGSLAVVSQWKLVQTGNLC